MNNMKIITFKERIRRAIKAFKGENIGSLQFGIDVKKCSECEFKNKTNIAYLCDRQVADCACGPDHFCNHTTDIVHAKNFKRMPRPDGNMYVEQEKKDDLN